jgi:hypothetical protein
VLPTGFKAHDVIQAVGLKETIGAFGGRSRFRHWPFGEVLLHVFEARTGRTYSHRSSTVFFGRIDEYYNRYGNGKAAVFYSNGNSFIGTFSRDVFHCPDCSFRWNCGMVFSGQIEFSLRCGPGRLKFVDGSVFEGDFSHGQGTFQFERGKVKVAGW